MHFNDFWPFWGALLPTFLGALLAAELGYRLGAYRARRGATARSGAGTMVGSLFALLAFMLAFTFGLAASRFDTRRALIVEEANVIGTAFLRTDLISTPWRDEIREQLREYVAVRLEATRISSSESINAGIIRSEEIHKLIWARAIEAHESVPAVTNGLVLQAINDLIDVHTDRVASALYSKLSATIWVCLLLLAAAGMMATGYQAGSSGPRPSLVTLLLILAFSIVIMLIADLDNYEGGWLQSSHAPLEDVGRMMQSVP